MKTKWIAFLLIASMFSCSKPIPRKPISISSGSFLKQSVERNKKLIAKEEAVIQTIIKNDSLNDYVASENGYWYYYENKNKEITEMPKFGDKVTFDYELRLLNNTVIYSKEELGTQEYYVDKENIMEGLRSGIKLMKANERVVFLFPSNQAYGYHGDNKKITTNTPLKAIVNVHSVEQEKTE
ncbi:gliding motility-associated peptidyl-prolyl isomerase GldI [Spongiivirga citrea]|uniref:Peptidyl-prolyl cis-trans isomerase n=1 Tax=Spongiivirga citrea TaxID=1481457 RepID=A0A6M0CKY8_9FLAO|nr:gliding motility-associated peptidyl-prolyl isomerase GldI [Spongiivirga citrea]NER18551.1 gliding motility-associated peptidyl-prolyl isomerase GldI [Spongiivirga citrea]